LTLNRQSLVNSPIENARLLWRDQKATEKSAGRTEQKPVKMQVAPEGIMGKKFVAYRLPSKKACFS
jgi:hypothetical protein